VNVLDDEVISLRIWGLISWLGTPLACPDVPKGDPEAYSTQ